MPLMIGVSKLPLGTNAPAMRSLQVALTDGPGISGQTLVQPELSIEQCPCVQSEACWHARLLSLHVPPCGGQSETDEQVSPVPEQLPTGGQLPLHAWCVVAHWPVRHSWSLWQTVGLFGHVPAGLHVPALHPRLSILHAAGIPRHWLLSSHGFPLPLHVPPVHAWSLKQGR